MCQVSPQLEESTAVLTPVPILEERTDLNLLGLQLLQSLSNGRDEVVADANITTLAQRGAGERALSANLVGHYYSALYTTTKRASFASPPRPACKAAAKVGQIQVVSHDDRGHIS